MITEEKALLSSDECQSILESIISCHESKERAKEVKLKAYNLILASEAIGFQGAYYRLLLTYADAVNGSTQERTIIAFVKSRTKRYVELESIGIFKKEVSLYATLLMELQKYSTIRWVPQFYYARDDVLVTQDMTEYHYAIGQKPELSALEMRMILRSLAAMHSASLAYEAKHGVNIGETFIELQKEYTISPQTAWYITGLRMVLAVIKNFRKYQSPALQQFIAEVLETRLEAIYSMISASKKYCNVLCHRDVWYGNVFFPINAEKNGSTYQPAVLVDFQTCRYCPAAIDVVAFIYLHLSRKERRTYEMDYLSLYYSTFKADMAAQQLVADDYITLEQFLQSYRELELMGCLYKTLLCSIIKVPKEFVTQEYKLVDRVPRVLDYLKENKVFRLAMEECIEDLMDNILTEEEKQRFNFELTI